MVGKGVYNGGIEGLLSNFSEGEIASYYIEELYQIPQVICSPLRKDEHPSFRIYSPDGIKVRYYDYVTGETGGIIDFVCKKFNLTLPQAINKINSEVGKKNPVRISTSNGITIRKDKAIFTVKSRRREWQDYDFEYWDSYGISKPWLLHSDIYPIDYIFIISENGYTKTIKADKYAYTFIERKDGIISEKIYQPFNKEGVKWRSGHDSSVWDLWTKLPERGERLLITSSRKDALCLWANLGIPAVSLQGEAMNAKPQVVNELKERFKKIYVLYDNDFSKDRNAGRIDGEKFCKTFGLIQLEIPEYLKSKDPSDLYKNHGKETFRKTILDLIKHG